ncbi:hypothetical protein EDD15DRAFT_1728816 [Pisolithus albus]|nr:hypothetical protein EDD15DRAFT_1728816 [Pisolithus albus]
MATFMVLMLAVWILLRRAPSAQGSFLPSHDFEMTPSQIVEPLIVSIWTVPKCFSKRDQASPSVRIFCVAVVSGDWFRGRGRGNLPRKCRVESISTGTSSYTCTLRIAAIGLRFLRRCGTS